VGSEMESEKSEVLGGTFSLVPLCSSAELLVRGGENDARGRGSAAESPSPARLAAADAVAPCRSASICHVPCALIDSVGWKCMAAAPKQNRNPPIPVRT